MSKVPKILQGLNLGNYVSFAVILSGLVLWIWDKAGSNAVQKSLIENYGEQLKELNMKMEKQLEFNGKVKMYIELDAGVDID